MILPAKHLPEERALLTVGAQLLKLLNEPKSVSRLWNELRKNTSLNSEPITFDWFVLALDLLAAIRVVKFEDDRIVRINS
jgi:hypothetical protein